MIILAALPSKYFFLGLLVGLIIGVVILNIIGLNSDSPEKKQDG
jgi:hypothetical protein